MLDLDALSPEEILSSLYNLSPGDLVVLVQSSSFRLNQFRIRIELFKRGFRVVEHPHLARLKPEEYDIYLDALFFDESYLTKTGTYLKSAINRCHEISLVSRSGLLRYSSRFEDAKLNIGDFSGMKNIGGQFPIGEVFSEPVNLEQVNGTVDIFAFGDRDFSVCYPDVSFRAVISGGILVDAPGSPESFRIVLEEIRKEEHQVRLRELGFGLNRAMNIHKRVSDVSVYERMNGIHLSLGGKHTLYTKPGYPKSSRFHVDIFAEVVRVDIDDQTVYHDQAYVVPP